MIRKIVLISIFDYVLCGIHFILWVDNGNLIQLQSTNTDFSYIAADSITSVYILHWLPSMRKCSFHNLQFNINVSLYILVL